MQMREMIGRAHNADCISLMKGMRKNSIDMVFADPPFNLKKKYTSYKDNLPLQEYIDWTDEWLKEAMRILRPTGSILFITFRVF